MKKIFLNSLLIAIFFAFPKAVFAEETTVIYGPYSYGTTYDETINIPAISRIYIGELQNDTNYNGNYLNHGGFFVGGWAGYLQINGVTIMYEEHAAISEESINFTTYYWKSVYEDSSRYREAATDSSFGADAVYYAETATITENRRWMEITNLVDLGLDNVFSFYHYTESDQGYVIKIVSNEASEEITYATDFTPTTYGFSFDNFSTAGDAELIRDFFHIYNYNALYYSDWQGNYYWKWDVDKIINSFQPDEESGKCFGFNFSAWDFYNGLDKVTNYKANAGVAYDLKKTGDIENKIKGSFYYQMSQEFDDYYNTHQQAGDYTITNVYTVIKDYFSNQEKADFMLGVFNPVSGGHALTPYRLVESADGQTGYIYVYDSNFQGQEKAIIFNNLNSQSSGPRWRYLPDYDSENGDVLYYYFLPNIYDGTVPTLPGQKKSQMILNSLNAQADILITDSEGNKLGYDAAGNFYNEIPKASPQWNLQSNGKILGFVLPSDSNYRISSTNSSDLEIYLSDSNKSYLLSTAKKSDEDYLTINDNSLGYVSNETASINLIIAKKDNAEIYQYSLNDLALQANESVAVAITNNYDLEINNTFTSNHSANITINKNSLSQQISLEANDVTLAAQDIQTLNITNWDDLANSTVKLNQETIDVKIASNLTLPAINKIKPNKIKKSRLSKARIKNYRFTIYGQNFQKKTKVLIGKKKPKHVDYISKQKLTITVNLKKFKKGFYQLTIINPNKQKVVKQNALQIF